VKALDSNNLHFTSRRSMDLVGTGLAGRYNLLLEEICRACSEDVIMIMEAFAACLCYL
jgi:hypothetical protein